MIGLINTAHWRCFYRLSQTKSQKSIAASILFSKMYIHTQSHFYHKPKFVTSAHHIMMSEASTHMESLYSQSIGGQNFLSSTFKENSHTRVMRPPAVLVVTGVLIYTRVLRVEAQRGTETIYLCGPLSELLTHKISKQTKKPQIFKMLNIYLYILLSGKTGKTRL